MKKQVTIIIFVALLVLIPLFLKDPRWLHIIIMIGIYIILAGGLRLVMSTGQVSFAHAGFWAIGAYASALFVLRLGLPFWLAFPMSGVIGGIVSILIGYPCFKVRGPYFFIITLAFGEILRLLFMSWVALFGGANGISGIPYPDKITIAGLEVIEFSSQSFHYYYLMLFLLLPSLFLYYRLENSRFGVACSAVRENDNLAESLGVDIMQYKMTAFLVACSFASLAGSFYAHYLTYISPGFFTFDVSILFLLMVVIGGSESTTGVIIGVVLLTLITEFSRAAARLETIIFGGTLVLIMLFIPGGLWGLLRRFLERIPFSKVYGR